ncbi:hypothetical protein [Rhodohalobacter sp.]|uniref:hypothetical protein n=1 Tax=Rhodohalobacter sp. TaxID=1974210 RepID=UPI002ACE4CCA|nr:hypothetical protein [Rhodohalobacter sp.]MDZ7755606.1 hypothetical protein [Rhodohalobacter sp.]
MGNRRTVEQKNRGTDEVGTEAENSILPQIHFIGFTIRRFFSSTVFLSTANL